MHKRNTENYKNLCDEPTSMKETLKMMKIFMMNIQAWKKNSENDQNLHDEPTNPKETLKMIKIFMMNLQT